MHTHSTKAWPKPVLATAAAILIAATTATSAFAECDEDQEAFVGKAIATATAAKLSTVVPGAGKQMIDVSKCDAGAGGLVTDFKFNVIGSDGLYWVQGKAKVSGSTVSELKFLVLSPNLATVSAAKGVKLASS